MTEEELHALLTLQHVPNLGDGSIKRLVKRFGSAEEVLKQKKKALLETDQIGTFRIKEIFDPEHVREAEKEVKFIQDNNLQYTAYFEPQYPARLKHCLDGPVLIFTRGEINFENSKIISVVGTRKVTTQGIAFVKKFIEDLAPIDPVIVSGFAYGVDIQAHRAAMDHDLETWGVLAHGLDQIYPKVHAKYQKELEKRGGFITDFWSRDSFDRTNFLRRNRIIAGISEATVVIESAEKGGSLVTAEIANSYNRDVFAVPGRPDDSQSKGCNNLIKSQKAHLLTSAADLVYLLNWDIAGKPKPVQKQLFVDLDDQERKIWNCLKTAQKEHLDLIARSCNIPAFRVAGLLLNMELKGVVRPLPGKLFELV
ncbi:MAG: DNA-processing protein DprA [Leeuwenhoekiella sp.]